jgi:hypothetical protein
MSDALRTILTVEADALSRYEPVPDVAAVKRRTASPGRAGGRRLAGWTAPAAAAVLVVAVALGAFVLHTAGTHRRGVFAVPPPPVLGKVVPPLQVRQRLGAPPGHVNGPPVRQADALAVSQPSADGLTLRTVGVVRPHATPDAKGRPRVDRCVYTYTTPRADVLNGRCAWAQPTAAEAPAEPLTLDILGGPGRTWLEGTAPAGTAAIVLRSPGRKQVAVATAAAGTGWDSRPYYAAWWPRVGTDVIAVDRAGREIARTRLPSDRTSRTSAADPQLGTMEVPLRGWDRLGAPGEVPTPSRVDLLARADISPLVSVLMYGAVHGDDGCIVQQVRDLTGDTPDLGGASECIVLKQPIGAPAPDPISVGRSFAGSGEPQDQLLSGSAPQGTATIRLVAAGRTATFPAYDSGSRWQHRSYFIAPWPSAQTTLVTALDRDGRPLATTVSKGLNPHAFDARYLAAEKACLQQHGIEVTEHPNAGGAPDGFSYSTPGMSPKAAAALVDTCENAADQATK